MQGHIGALCASWCRPGDQGLLCKAASIEFVSSLYWCMRLFSNGRARHFPLLDFMRFLFVHFLSLSRSLCMATFLSGISVTTLSFVVPGNLRKVYFGTLLSRSLMKVFNIAEHSIGPWETPAVTGLQVEFMPLITMV